MDSSGDLMRCALCACKFDTRHAQAVHLKSAAHGRRLEQAEERARLRAQDERRDAQRTDFQARFGTQIQNLLSRYQDEAYATVGQLYAPPTWPEGACLSDSISSLYSSSRPRPHIVARRRALYRFVFKVVKLVYPDAKLDVYGSIPHRIDDESSDTDMSVLYRKEPDAVVLDTIGRAIELAAGTPFKVTRVLHARIPVISVADDLTQTHLDLSVWMRDKLHISQIFTQQLDVDDRIRPLVFCVRRFSKAHQINDAYSGYINSFGWTVAVMCYLMRLRLVPCMTTPTDMPADWRAADADHPASLGDLLLGFFEFMLNWDYKNSRLTMRAEHGVCAKEADKFEDYTFVCIERPQTPYQNVTRQVEASQWKRMRSLLQMAFEKLRTNQPLHSIF